MLTGDGAPVARIASAAVAVVLILAAMLMVSVAIG